MAEEMARGVGPAKIDIAYERCGDPEHPPVLLIMGAGAQLINWPNGLCAGLVERGLQVIRFDNRDAGRSTHFSDVPPPDFPAVLAGDFSTVPYTLSDMAADTVGLLDALGHESAHIVGASQGAMIGQTMAIDYPRRVRSLTSMLSTTGNPEVGRTDPGVFELPGPNSPDRAGFVEWRVRLGRALAGSGFAFDAEAAAELAARAWDRDHDGSAMLRQVVAVVASGDRTPRLRELDVPALVMHGTEDRMFDISGGRATAEAIPGAKLRIFEGMGHSLPRELWDTFADNIAELTLSNQRKIL
ncbi:alpha/beta fold hydrolase [Nocardia sp. CDC159]|uniref:Alpha/beta fold hydrolase n=1 Tax=Nocardia pulmonis TaxID=2951408 RepID=A0A9X2J0P8_9NOCA|nr:MULTISPECIES: alpha/beta hydrolase [Nocardia]MCM6778059.1 alpha/beta fold hydrolase [Nocardia pulmonis]MCM6790948.1 alpha/beta fold hydrolase [Nocardia sp. CDC159]